MRALLVMRPDAYERFGGDTTLVVETAQALRALGVEADVVSTLTPDARGYEVAHVFNAMRPEVCGPQVESCRAARVPVALSTVWFDLREFLGRGSYYHELAIKAKDPSTLERRYRSMRSRSADSFLSYRTRTRLTRDIEAQASVLRRAHVLLPNSSVEARDCMLKLGVREVPFEIVPVGASLQAAEAWSARRAGVLCVGRLEPRKNQTMTVLALRDVPVDLTIAGAAHDAYPTETLQTWAPRARFTGQVSDGDRSRLYGAAHVHILPSWIETVGLASIEAAAGGAQLVVSDRGPEVEYFGNDAEYADPADPDSLRAAVLRALARPARSRGDALDRRIRALTWERSARATMRGYEVAIAQAKVKY
jgi:glycosyltransferase involved in cell wall biosynthesis